MELPVVYRSQYLRSLAPHQGFTLDPLRCLKRFPDPYMNQIILQHVLKAFDFCWYLYERPRSKTRYFDRTNLIYMNYCAPSLDVFPHTKNNLINSLILEISPICYFEVFWVYRGLTNAYILMYMLAYATKNFGVPMCTIILFLNGFSLTNLGFH